MDYEEALDELCAMTLEEDHQSRREPRGHEKIAELKALPDTVQTREYSPDDLDETQWLATDDVHDNAPINLRKLRDARREEMEYVRRLAVYKYRWREEALAQGHKPVRVRWVDQDKGER